MPKQTQRGRRKSVGKGEILNVFEYLDGFKQQSYLQQPGQDCCQLSVGELLESLLRRLNGAQVPCRQHYPSGRSQTIQQNLIFVLHRSQPLLTTIPRSATAQLTTHTIRNTHTTSHTHAKTYSHTHTRTHKLQGVCI